MTTTDWLRNLSPLSPTLVLDEGKARRNIAAMAARARASGCRFRPHFKTHQSAAIGEWFRREGVEAITVSSVGMARYFAAAGWDDVTLAFPVNPRAARQIDALAREVTFHVVVDAESVVTALASRVAAPLHLWLKIDAGYHRAGLPWDATGRMVSLVRAVTAVPNFSFVGLIAHSGHTYAAAGPEPIRRIHRKAVARLGAAREALTAAGLPDCLVSLGDTPACSLVEDFRGCDEIRPGAFVFNDLMQWRLGACGVDDIAVAVACPVAGVYPERGEILLHGGAVHFGKEFLGGEGKGGGRVFGYPARVTQAGWDGIDEACPLVSISQEHGILRAGPERVARTGIGDIVPVLPVHSCLTCDLFAGYKTISGERISRRRSNDPTEASG